MGDRDYSLEPLQVLSYGGGVQSTAMLALIAEGLLERPDLIIHSDTGSEIPETERFVNEVAKPYAEEVLKIPFVIVRSDRGSLHEDYFKHGNIPVIGMRSCTENFKILPQRRYVRKIVGNGRGKLLCVFWLGITTDEERRRPAERDPRQPKWTGLRYPLLDDHRISRAECVSVNEAAGFEVGKSGCWLCPYQGTRAWASIRDTYPDLFQIALDLETKKFEVKKGKMGLLQCNPPNPILSALDEKLGNLGASACDAGAGCFL